MTQLSYRERHNVHELCFTRSKVKYKKSYFLRSTIEVLIYFIWYLDIDFQGTVTCFCDVQRLDFWSGEPFFKICFWWKNPLPLTLRCPRRLLYQYSRAIWSILEVLNAIFCIFVQALLRKLEVIQKNCTKAYYFIVSVPTNGSNVAFNVVIWLSFLSTKFSIQRSTFFG